MTDKELKLSILKQAVEGRASTPALLWVLKTVARLYCPKAYGFEGLDTYIDCGECIVCLAKEVTK